MGSRMTSGVALDLAEAAARAAEPIAPPGQIGVSPPERPGGTASWVERDEIDRYRINFS